jgi:hypothetical protein
MIEQIINILKVGLVDKLKIHHSLYRLPCTAEFLEELISNILAENGYINDWQPNRSHSISVDMTIEDGPSFSVKSGIYDVSKSTLTFSGSRLGKHETLPEMVNSVIENKADYYICVSKTDQDWSNTPALFNMKTYYLFVFESTALKYDSIWNTVESSRGGYKYAMEIDGMKASIHPSLSHQLWTTVSTNIVGVPHKIDILM